METDILGKKKKGGRKGQPVQRTAPEIDAARKALMKLKYAMGVRKYLRNPKIAEIFEKQKIRMGDMLGKIDRELANHPREDRSTPSRFQAWQTRDLQKWWDEYMNEKFNTASGRLDNDMTKYLPMFDTEWLQRVSHAYPELTAFQRDIRDIMAAWKSEKATTWNAPWK